MVQLSTIRAVVVLGSICLGIIALWNYISYTRMAPLYLGNKFFHHTINLREDLKHFDESSTIIREPNFWPKDQQSSEPVEDLKHFNQLSQITLEPKGREISNLKDDLRHFKESSQITFNPKDGKIINHGKSDQKLTLRQKFSIAIGMGITSKGMDGQGKANLLDQMPLFQELLPSFCDTASRGHRYHFYFGYDNNDTFFNDEITQHLWRQRLISVQKTKTCQQLGQIDIHLVKCTHSGRPAWAQNDAMMAAYKDGHDFFYRVNDDTVMITENWTDIFIDELSKMKPQFVGVVGPNHTGGLTFILTYDFVHRTHIDIFGYYYPREFAWWNADTWMTLVYKPSRSVQVPNVRLRHSMSLNMRYNVGFVRPSHLVTEVITKSKIKLNRYLGRNITVVP